MTITGALILGVFATIWWVVGLQFAGHSPALVYPLPLAVAATLGWLALRLARQQRVAPGPVGDSAEQARRDRLVRWASAAEGVAIFVVAGIVLPTIGHREATASAIALIVGAHFVPLARGLPAPAYYVTAAALTGLGIAGFGVADVGARITLVSAGAASVLWLTAAWSLRRASGGGASGRRASAAERSAVATAPAPRSLVD